MSKDSGFIYTKLFQGRTGSQLCHITGVLDGAFELVSKCFFKRLHALFPLKAAY